MSYRALKALYYEDNTSDKSDYLSKYKERIAGDASIVFDFDVHGAPAFLIVTPEILGRVSNILLKDRDAGKIDLPPIALEQFFKKSLVEEIWQTLDIEHVHSTRKEIVTALDDQGASKKAVRLSGMTVKYAILGTKRPIPLQTAKDIRALYDELCLSEVLEENPSNAPDGELFRKGEVYVHSKTDQRIHAGLFPEGRIISAMEKALQIVNDAGYQYLIRVAVFHYMFAYIHPFYDGNGRMARFLSSYLLTRNLGPLIGVRLSYTIKAHIDVYYKLFKETNNPKNKGDLTLFVQGFLLFLDEAYDNLLQALRERMERLVYFAKQLRKTFENDNRMVIAYILLQATLFGDEGLVEQDIATYAKKSRTTVRSSLEDETLNKLLCISKKGRKRLFSLDLERIESLNESSTGDPKGEK